MKNNNNLIYILLFFPFLALVSCEKGKLPSDLNEPPKVIVPKDSTHVVVLPPLDSLSTFVTVPVSLGIGNVELFFSQIPGVIRPDSTHILGKIGIRKLDTTKYEARLFLVQFSIYTHLPSDSKFTIKDYFRQDNIATPLENLFNSKSSFWWYSNDYDATKNNPIVTEKGLDFLITKTNKSFPQSVEGHLQIFARVVIYPKGKREFADIITRLEILHEWDSNKKLALLRFTK
ncbi:hypothetical protein EGI22_17330 [Lacihabitans sp. LS3-19]|uniref:hypothetical protein n=1 Tax=Lacihabitans sp. LS3-19 TaxID=2487335 RepID=UPI0020CCA7DE|nr:hypothetical protein [Lacihabitans sp. LS3-19]MCP9769668.1 hypothetical protein [Lacihabitans sp. LS3-19]